MYTVFFPVLRAHEAMASASAQQTTARIGDRSTAIEVVLSISPRKVIRAIKDDRTKGLIREITHGTYIVELEHRYV